MFEVFFQKLSQNTLYENFNSQELTHTPQTYSKSYKKHFKFQHRIIIAKIILDKYNCAKFK